MLTCIFLMLRSPGGLASVVARAENTANMGVFCRDGTTGDGPGLTETKNPPHSSVSTRLAPRREPLCFGGVESFSFWGVELLILCHIVFMRKTGHVDLAELECSTHAPCGGLHVSRAHCPFIHVGGRHAWCGNWCSSFPCWHRRSSH